LTSYEPGQWALAGSEHGHPPAFILKGKRIRFSCAGGSLLLFYALPATVTGRAREQTMNTGMLWLDNDPKTKLAAKVIRAMDYYTHKYGRVPNLCLVNPAALEKESSNDIGGLTVRPYRPVLPGHLWMGIEDKN